MPISAATGCGGGTISRSLDARVALMRTAALILMTLASVPHPTPLVSATLVGFLPQGDLLVLEKRSGGEEILRRLSHDGARSERIEGPKEALGVRAPTPLRQDRDRWRIRDLELVLIEEAPLGGRRSVELQAR